MTDFPTCPEELPGELKKLVEEFGRIWASHPFRVKPASNTVAHWYALIEEWINDPALPLFVRKMGRVRGSKIQHVSHRNIIYCDNSPAHWSFVMACEGQCPTLADIKILLEKTSIPTVYIQNRSELPLVSYGAVLPKRFNVNNFNWKLGHIKPVGLRIRGDVSQMPVEALEDHFRRLMSPGNMFVIPKVLAGIAELKPVITAIAASDLS